MATKPKKPNGSVNDLAEALRNVFVEAVQPLSHKIDDLHNKMLDQGADLEHKMIEVGDKVDRMATENKKLNGVLATQMKALSSGIDKRFSRLEKRL